MLYLPVDPLVDGELLLVLVHLMETDVVAELLEIPLLSPLDETMEFSDILLSYIYAVVLRPLC